MKPFKQFFLEYFVPNAKAYYMTNDGMVHDVQSDHISQVIEDFDLEGDISDLFQSEFGEDINWDKDWDYVADYVIDVKTESGILFIVLDTINKIVYVRGSKNDPNPIQREKLIDFCISKGSELIYDPHAVA